MKRTPVNRRLRLIAAIVIGLTMIAARRTNGPTFGCRRGFYPTGGATTAFMGAGTSTFGGQSIPASFATPGPDRAIWLLSDTSAQTYVFDQDISDTSQRFGAGSHVICSIYATQDDVAKNGDDDTISQDDDFVSFCGVAPGLDVRSACPGRACPTCTLLAPPECFVRSAERLHYVLNGGVEYPVALSSAQIPWDFDRDAQPQGFMMDTDNSGTWWPNPIRSIRSYDTGACRLNIPWPQLATLVNQAFLPIFLGQLREVSEIEAIFKALVKGSAGPQLRGDAFFAYDEIFLSNFVDAFVQAGIPGSVQREISGTAFTRFSLTTTTNAAGFARLTIPYITSWTDHLPTTPWEVGETVAQSIPGANSLPGAFPKALRDAMLFPAFSSTGVVAPCSPASNPTEGSAPDQAGVGDCADWFAANDIPPPGMQSQFAGPERGCYPRSAFASAWSSVLPPSATGICGTRLQARHVNILPEGLQIVILDQGLQDPTPDDMARFVTSLPGSVGPILETQNVSIDCNPPTPPINPRMHLIDPRSITLAQGVNAACGHPMTPACGSL